MNTQFPAIEEITTGLTQDERGIWQAQSQYAANCPDDAHVLFAPVEEHSYWFQHRATMISRLVGKYAPHDTMFDIGGGNGYMAMRLQQDGFQSVLVEPSQYGANQAHQRGVSHIIQATFEEASFQPNSLPAAGMFDVLEHIAHDVSFLRDVRRAMRPGGHLFLTVPAYQSLWSGADLYAQHVRRYSAKEVTQVLEQAGFEVPFAGYGFVFLLPAILLLRSLPYRLGKRSMPSKDTLRNSMKTPGGWLGRMLKASLDMESSLLEQDRSLPCGASCFVVAKASNNTEKLN